MEVHVAERGCDLAEAVRGHPDLEILVLPALRAEEEVERPAGGDIPRHVDATEPARDILGRPGIPLGVVGVHRPSLPLRPAPRRQRLAPT